VTALITGASSGIGLELARMFAANRHDVVLVARSEDKLREVARECESKGVKAHVVAADLAKPEAARYLAFLRSSLAKTVFETYGFTFLIKSRTRLQDKPDSSAANDQQNDVDQGMLDRDWLGIRQWRLSFRRRV